MYAPSLQELVVQNVAVRSALKLVERRFAPSAQKMRQNHYCNEEPTTGALSKELRSSQTGRTFDDIDLGNLLMGREQVRFVHPGTVKMTHPPLELQDVCARSPGFSSSDRIVERARRKWAITFCARTESTLCTQFSSTEELLYYASSPGYALPVATLGSLAVRLAVATQRA